MYFSLNRLKGCGSRVLRMEFPFLRSRLPTLWSRSYYDCPACGLSQSRDHVSAQLILSRARNGLLGLNVEDARSCVPQEAVAL